MNKIFWFHVYYIKGIITPYTSQLQTMKLRCRQKNLPNIVIGTAEAFQGQEFRAIIISTVRSGGGLGFVADAKVNSLISKFFHDVFNMILYCISIFNFLQRLNVMVTRAKSLLVIVGHADTLWGDPNWKSLILHCSNNNSMIKEEEE